RGPSHYPIRFADTAAVATHGERRPRAAVLVFLGKRDAVARRHLTREPDRVDSPGIAVPHFQSRILRPSPLRGVASIEVGGKSWELIQRAVVAHVAEEPQPVALDRPAT